ncbi:MAG: hypothetical protein IJI53_12930 [Clostridia bacterium]|nr:hypothetical protein [Clostridia bacterium]
MTFARSISRLAGLTMLLLILIFSVSAAAFAADVDPVVFTMQISPQELSAPGEVSVSLNISNPSREDMIAPVTLYDPAGNVVASFGDGGSYVLKAGDTRAWEGKWNVTQEQLDAGVIAYEVRYHLEDDTGALAEISRQASARIQFQGEHANLTVNRKIEPEVVRSGGQASVTYELRNTGNVQLSDIRVQENISKTPKTVKSLAPGDQTEVTFTSRIGNADLKSNATITYKAAGETKTQSVKVDDAVIALAKPNLKLELSSGSDAVNVGERATLVISFINEGNVAYSNVSVTDAKAGELASGISIPAGETVTVEKQFILTEPVTFKATATLPDNTGETKKLTSNELRIGVYDPEKQLLLTLNLTADQDTVSHVPADVRFHLKVTNNSNIKAEKIVITHGKTQIYTIASLDPGASTTLDRDATIPQAGQFRFTATLKDSLNNEVQFESNTIHIAYAQNTPAPTTVPVVTVAPPEYVSSAPVDPLLTQGRDVLRYVMLGLMGLFGAALALFAVSSLVRLNRYRKSKAAYDHLDLAERRDYTEPVDDEDFDEDEVTEEPRDDSGEAEGSRPDEETIDLKKAVVLPHEKLLRSAAEGDAAKAPTQEDMPSVDTQGGYRVTRASAPDDGEPRPAVSRAEQPEAQAEADVSSRRHRRSARKVDEE